MKKLVLTLLAWSGALWCVAPFLWQILTSFKTGAEIVRIPPTYLPDGLNVSHYVSLFTRKPFAIYLWNSFFISSAATVLCVGFSAMAAYSFSRFSLRAAKPLQGLLVAVSLAPPVIFFFPLYELVRLTGTANHSIALIVPYLAFNLPLATFILTAFFRTVPLELEEAARVDGFNRVQILLRIIVPLSAPALATTAILVFISCWNEFLLALTFMTEDTSKTVTAGIASLSGGTLYELPWGAISAAVVVSTLPVVALVLVFQKRIIQGLTAGAIKG